MSRFSSNSRAPTAATTARRAEEREFFRYSPQVARKFRKTRIYSYAAFISFPYIYKCSFYRLCLVRWKPPVITPRKVRPSISFQTCLYKSQAKKCTASHRHQSRAAVACTCLRLAVEKRETEKRAHVNAHAETLCSFRQCMHGENLQKWALVPT